VTAAKPGGFSMKSIVTVVATFAAATGGVLSLLGAGVAWSVNDLSIPHDGATSSAFEFLQLSPLAVGYMSRRLVDTSWSRIFELPSLGFLAVVLGAIFALGIAVLYAGAWRRSPPVRRNLSIVQRLRRYFHPAVSPSIDWVLSRASVGALAATFLSAAAMVAFGFVVYVVLSVGIALVTLVPNIGLNAGRDYIKEYVVGPTSCAPLKPRSSRQSWELQSDRSANCVVVCKDGKVLGYGRVVFGTSTSLALYDPDTGDATRVPTGDTVIRAIDSLDIVDTDACRVTRTAPRISSEVFWSKPASDGD
jgi:hypothetical protein